MVLKDDFYHITKQDGRHFEVTMNASHAIYSGHFPGRPITPGACLLQMTQELLSLAEGQPIRLAGVKNLKFVALHTPDKPVCVDFTEKGNGEFQVVIADSETIYAKMICAVHIDD